MATTDAAPAPAGPTTGPPAPALTAAVDLYLAHLTVERGLSANTVSAYRRDLARYARHLAEAGVAAPGDVTPELVRAYVAAARTGEDGGAPLSAASAARALAAVRGWHAFCEAEGRASGNPARDVQAPARPRRLPKALPVDDVARLLEAAGAGEGEVPLRDQALLELLYSTGARISEAVDLDVDDLDLDGPAPSVRLFGKGRKERVVPVGSYAARAVEAYLVRGRPVLATRGSGTPAVFLGARGARLSRQSGWAVLQGAAERAGLHAHVSPHTLRHSFATHLLAGGADVRVVQELLGHASVTTTQLYTLVTPDALREVYVASHPRARG